METKSRKIDRKLAANPDDPELLQKMMTNKIRMGETEVVTYYKIEQNGRFLSEKTMNFTKAGTRFKERKAVVLALKKLMTRHKKAIARSKKPSTRSSYGVYGSIKPPQKPKPIGDLKLVVCRLHTILETRVEKIDPATEIGKLQLLDIQAKKKALDVEEKRLKKEMRW